MILYGEVIIFHGRCLYFDGKATGFFEETRFIMDKLPVTFCEEGPPYTNLITSAIRHC